MIKFVVVKAHLGRSRTECSEASMKQGGHIGGHCNTYGTADSV